MLLFMSGFHGHRLGLHDLAKLGEDARVNKVRLGTDTKTPGKVPDSFGINNRSLHILFGQLLDEQRFIAPSGFHDHDDTAFLLLQFQAEVLNCVLRVLDLGDLAGVWMKDIQRIFGNIDTHKNQIVFRRLTS